jgi:plastocyanin domain-containing protein
MKKIFAAFVFAMSLVPVAASANSQIIKVEVTEAGFVPPSIEVKPGTDVTLEVTRKTESTCAKDIQVPSKNIKTTALPMGKPVLIKLGKLEKGEVKFGCGMNMMDSGRIRVN